MVATAENAEQDVPGGNIVLGRYQILGKLAQGGMAEVYLARQVGPGGYQKLVVTKRVRPHLARDRDFVGMFVNEARLAAMINHPNVVQIFDLGEEPAVSGEGSDWFLAMEYLDGRDMLQVGRACRAHNKAVPFDVTARIMADACAGLEFAHNLRSGDGRLLNLVHRDMSPENIIITFEGQVKVVDFGVAKAADNTIQTQAGQIKGKLGYVAPEAILGKPIDARADIFAVGATLYLFLSGRPAFTGSSPMEIFERSLRPPPSPQEVNPRVPPGLAEICMKALAQDRDQRYRSAGELRAALDGYLASTPRPLGPPQLSQFMRILFPPDKDPTRQRIDKLLLEVAAFPPPRKTVPPKTPGSPLSAAEYAPAEKDEAQADDDERTLIAPERARTQAPREVEIAPLGAPAAQPKQRIAPAHLRSVGVSEDIPDKSSPRSQPPVPIERGVGLDLVVDTQPEAKPASHHAMRPSTKLERFAAAAAKQDRRGATGPAHLDEPTVGVDFDGSGEATGLLAPHRAPPLASVLDDDLASAFDEAVATQLPDPSSSSYTVPGAGPGQRSAPREFATLDAPEPAFEAPLAPPLPPSLDLSHELSPDAVDDLPVDPVEASVAVAIMEASVDPAAGAAVDLDFASDPAPPPVGMASSLDGLPIGANAEPPNQPLFAVPAGAYAPEFEPAWGQGAGALPTSNSAGLAGGVPLGLRIGMAALGAVSGFAVLWIGLVASGKASLLFGH